MEGGAHPGRVPRGRQLVRQVGPPPQARQLELCRVHARHGGVAREDVAISASSRDGALVVCWCVYCFHIDALAHYWGVSRQIEGLVGLPFMPHYVVGQDAIEE